MSSEQILGMITYGKITLSVNRRPLLSIDSEKKILAIDTSGFEKSNLKLSSLLEVKQSKGRMLLDATHKIKRLTKNGWQFSIYDQGKCLFTSSQPHSKMGLPLRISPINLKRLLRIL